jgi:DNA gyrase subunit A
MFVTRRGQTLRVTEQDIREMGRSSHGVKGIRLRDGDELTGAIRVENDKSILIMTEKGYGKRIDFDQFHIHGRGTGGQRIFGNTEAKGEIIGILAVSEKDEIVCMTSQGKTLRVSASTITKQGASASGITVLKIDLPDYLIGIDKVSQDE